MADNKTALDGTSTSFVMAFEDVSSVFYKRVTGAAAENTAAKGSPLLGGGRYDVSDRTLDDGDVGALAITSSGQLRVVLNDITDDYTRQVGRFKLVNDAGNVFNPIVQVAHGSADNALPTKISNKAREDLFSITPVDEDDVTDVYAGTDGVQIVRQHCALGDIVSEVDTNTNGTSTEFGTQLASPGSGIRLCITDVTISNSSDSNITVDLRDGAAGSVLWTFPVPANGGVTHQFGVPIKLTSNTALAYHTSAATSTVTICAAGFKTQL